MKSVVTANLRDLLGALAEPVRSQTARAYAVGRADLLARLSSPIAKRLLRPVAIPGCRLRWRRAGESSGAEGESMATAEVPMLALLFRPSLMSSGPASDWN